MNILKSVLTFGLCAFALFGFDAEARMKAVALCEALGVDAVMQINISGYSQSSGSGNIFTGSKTNTAMVQTGEVTMIDKSGKVLISGKAKSGPVHESSSRTIGSIEIDTGGGKPTGLHANLMYSYLGHLRQDLGLQWPRLIQLVFEDRVDLAGIGLAACFFHDLADKEAN